MAFYGVPDAHFQAMIKTDTTVKLTKDCSNYTLTTTGFRDSENTFVNEGEFENKVNDKMTLKSKVEVEGNVFTQTQKNSDGRVVVIRREFTDETLTETLTLSGWDGVAYRYFKA